jgi:hypothetical protein
VLSAERELSIPRKTWIAPIAFAASSTAGVIDSGLPFIQKATSSIPRRVSAASISEMRPRVRASDGRMNRSSWTKRTRTPSRRRSDAISSAIASGPRIRNRGPPMSRPKARIEQ